MARALVIVFSLAVLLFGAWSVISSYRQAVAPEPEVSRQLIDGPLSKSESRQVYSLACAEAEKELSQRGVEDIANICAARLSAVSSELAGLNYNQTVNLAIDDAFEAAGLGQPGDTPALPTVQV